MVATEAAAAARAITNPDQQAMTLAAVADALAEAGQREQAAMVATEAAAAVRAITYPYQEAEALVAVARALARPARSNRPLLWPARSPMLTGRHVPAAWRRWLRLAPGPASTNRPPRWPTPSPTRTSRRGPRGGG